MGTGLVVIVFALGCMQQTACMNADPPTPHMDANGPLLYEEPVPAPAPAQQQTKAPSPNKKSSDVVVGALTAVVMSYPNVRNVNLTSILTSLTHMPIIKETILVWNSKEKNPDLGELHRFRVIKQERNSMNNRWMLARMVKTNAIITVDDDMMLSEKTIKCMYHAWNQDTDRVVGGWVRGVCNGKWWSSENGSSDKGCGSGNLVENPMIVPRSALVSYAAPKYTELRNYVDTQAAHCDDVLLNAVAVKLTGKTPISVNLKVDQFSVETGMGSQPHRNTLRVECLEHISKQTTLLPAVRPESIDCRA